MLPAEVAEVLRRQTNSLRELYNASGWYVQNAAWSGSTLSMDKSCCSSFFMLIGHRQPAAGVHDALCMHCIMALNLAWKAYLHLLDHEPARLSQAMNRPALCEVLKPDTLGESATRYGRLIQG